MKTYVGTRPAYEPTGKPMEQGPAGSITVLDGAKTYPLAPIAAGMTFGWGKGDIRLGNVAMAILSDYLGSQDKARPLYMRFAHRYFGATMDPRKPFTLTGEDIDRIIASITETGEGNAQIAAQVAQEPMPISDDTAGRDAEGKISAPEVRG